MKTVNNLKKADAVMKIVIALSIVILYMAGLIAGPFAHLLLGLALLLLAIVLIGLFMGRMPFD